MAWADPISDLRIMLSDGPTDKLRAYKPVFGETNSANTLFKSFEFRRLTDFTAASSVSPLGVMINGDFIPPSAISSDSLQTGYFNIIAASAPTDSQQVTASYYIQWFTDAELVTFLVRASNWAGQSDDYTLTPSGLKDAVLKYSLHAAYTKLALKYAENIVETYRLQDSPDEKRMEIVKAYQDAAKQALKDAYEARDDVYKNRKGRALAPISGTISGNVRNPTRS